MAVRPLLFSAPMVRALIEGRKTQTRRIIKKPAALDALNVFGPKFLMKPGNADLTGYSPGDRIWVRETFNQSGAAWPELKHGLGRLHYRADPDNGWQSYWGNWRPSLFMPRWASRLTLIVTEVRVERLHDCSEADALAEGVAADLSITDAHNHWCDLGDGDLITGWDAREVYRGIWDHINGPGAWAENPWVVAVSFSVHQCNIDQMPGGAA